MNRDIPSYTVEDLWAQRKLHEARRNRRARFIVVFVLPVTLGAVLHFTW